MSEEKVLEPQNEWTIGEAADRHDDPLLDCLLQLCKIHGRPASKTGLSSGLPLVHNRLTVDLFPRAAGRADLSSRILKKPLEEMIDVQLPALLLLNDRQAAILIGKIADSQNYKVLLPETGMGEVLKVLIQHKGIPYPQLDGLRDLDAVPWPVSPERGAA